MSDEKNGPDSHCHAGLVALAQRLGEMLVNDLEPYDVTFHLVLRCETHGNHTMVGNAEPRTMVPVLRHQVTVLEQIQTKLDAGVVLGDDVGGGMRVGSLKELRDDIAAGGDAKKKVTH